MQAPTLDAERLFGPLDGSLDTRRTGGERHVVEVGRERAPVRIRHFAAREFVERAARARAKRLDIDLVERHADDPAARNEAGARQVKGAETALAENGGGVIGMEEAVTAVVILQRG